ncbi:MAG: hypothetical protein HY744_25965 [Deltaproteobacteria bacterium]|nr:hypothetical protein [Deltaproteobacteria bacterium]
MRSRTVPGVALSCLGAFIAAVVGCHLIAGIEDYTDAPGGTGTSTTSPTTAGTGGSGAGAGGTGSAGGTGTGGSGGSSYCGDGTCDPHENNGSCPHDCEPGCGDGTCDTGPDASPPESCSVCPADCRKCNGQPCGGAGECESNFCTEEGACCAVDCDGVCRVCNQAGTGCEAPGADSACPGQGFCSGMSQCSCQDGLQQGNESDVDCGLACLPDNKCDVGEHCGVNGDDNCSSGHCCSCCGQNLCQPGSQCDTFIGPPCDADCDAGT